MIGMRLSLDWRELAWREETDEPPMEGTFKSAGLVHLSLMTLTLS